MKKEKNRKYFILSPPKFQRAKELERQTNAQKTVWINNGFSILDTYVDVVFVRRFMWSPCNRILEFWVRTFQQFTINWQLNKRDAAYLAYSKQQQRKNVCGLTDIRSQYSVDGKCFSFRICGCVYVWEMSNQHQHTSRTSEREKENSDGERNVCVRHGHMLFCSVLIIGGDIYARQRARSTIAWRTNKKRKTKIHVKRRRSPVRCNKRIVWESNHRTNDVSCTTPSNLLRIVGGRETDSEREGETNSILTHAFFDPSRIKCVNSIWSRLTFSEQKIVFLLLRYKVVFFVGDESPFPYLFIALSIVCLLFNGK